MLQAWLEKGGLIMATSALGTGVDFPGIVFVLHVDLPYSMINFAQESERAGRAGEDFDSIIMVGEGKVEKMLSSGKGGLDEKMICEFVTTKECRRRVMSFISATRRSNAEAIRTWQNATNAVKG
jgi:superfamily II DNA helicase RecQ